METPPSNINSRGANNQYVANKHEQLTFYHEQDDHGTNNEMKMRINYGNKGPSKPRKRYVY